MVTEVQSAGAGVGPTPYPVRLEIDYPASSKRFWAIPLTGFLVKIIFLIPHIVVLYLIGMVVQVLQLIIWIPVLFGGKYPEWGFKLNTGYLRWSVRASAFFLGLTDQYPPFSMDN